MNMCMSQPNLPIRIHKQDTPIPRESDYVSGNFGSYEDEKSTLKEQDIEGDHRNLLGESSDTRSRVKDGLAGRTPQTGLLRNKSSSSLKEVRFSDQEFAAGTPVSNIKYNHLGFQNNNSFYPFYD